MVLLGCNRNAELLRLVGATFDSKLAFLTRIRKKNLIIVKILPFFCFINLSLLTFKLPNINWKCSESCDMLTDCTYDSAVFKIFRNITTVLHFYCAIINWNFIWNIDLNNGVYSDLCNKSACLNTVLYQQFAEYLVASVFFCLFFFNRFFPFQFKYSYSVKTTNIRLIAWRYVKTVWMVIKFSFNEVKIFV